MSEKEDELYSQSISWPDRQYWYSPYHLMMIPLQALIKLLEMAPGIRGQSVSDSIMFIVSLNRRGVIMKKPRSKHSPELKARGALAKCMN